jgi:hypothetical protein
MKCRDILVVNIVNKNPLISLMGLTKKSIDGINGKSIRITR